MVAKKEDLYIEQGATYDRSWQWREVDGDSFGDPVDLTGYIARMQLRPSIKATEVLLEATTENDMIVLGDATGTVQVILPDEATDTLDVVTAVYDLELESEGGFVYRLLEGKVKISPNVTRADG